MEFKVIDILGFKNLVQLAEAGRDSGLGAYAAGAQRLGFQVLVHGNTQPAPDCYSTAMLDFGSSSVYGLGSLTSWVRNWASRTMGYPTVQRGTSW